MDWLSTQRREAGRFYRRQLRNTFHITAAAFVILVCIGFVYGTVFPEQADELISRFTQQVMDADVIKDDGTFSAFAIFNNNFRAVTTSIIYGFIPLVFFPALPLGVNALPLGVFAAYYRRNGISFGKYLLSLLPHGIFEIPALILALALALYLCGCMTAIVRRKADRPTFQDTLLNVFRIQFLYVAPLLVIAALVEAYITPAVLGLLN